MRSVMAIIIFLLATSLVIFPRLKLQRKPLKKSEVCGWIHLIFINCILTLPCKKLPLSW